MFQMNLLCPFSWYKEDGTVVTNHMALHSIFSIHEPSVELMQSGTALSQSTVQIYWYTDCLVAVLTMLSVDLYHQTNGSGTRIWLERVSRTMKTSAMEDNVADEIQTGYL
jgi:hypothetical protein